MARNGYKIFDSDTHVGPYMEVLSEYLTEAEKKRLPAWERHRNVSKQGYQTYTKGQRAIAGGSAPPSPRRHRADTWPGLPGSRRNARPSPRVDHDPAERIKDMDYEGVDVNLTLPSGWFGTWTAGDDVALETGMYRAYHRWMEDYCGAYPERLGGVILACGARRRGQPRRNPALGQIALGVGRHGLRAVRHAARSPGSRADLGGGRSSTICASCCTRSP